MRQTACPSCGERERLQGRRDPAGIVITCQACAHEWRRGEACCQKCGRPGGVTAHQQLTRHPRGTLLAVVGSREVVLCPICDEQVVATVERTRGAVPEGYVSRFVAGEPAPNDDRMPAPRRTSRSTTRPSAPATSQPTPSAPEPAPPPQRHDPTLREAIESFLTEAADGTGSLPMLLLGPGLGLTTRMSTLDDDRARSSSRPGSSRLSASAAARGTRPPMPFTAPRSTGSHRMADPGSRPADRHRLRRRPC